MSRPHPRQLLDAFQQLARQHASDSNDCTIRFSWWIKASYFFYDNHPFPRPEQDRQLREYVMQVVAKVARHKEDFMHQCRFLYELGVLLRPG